MRCWSRASRKTSRRSLSSSASTDPRIRLKICCSRLPSPPGSLNSPAPTSHPIANSSTSSKTQRYAPRKPSNTSPSTAPTSRETPWSPISSTFTEVATAAPSSSARQRRRPMRSFSRPISSRRRRCCTATSPRNRERSPSRASSRGNSSAWLPQTWQLAASTSPKSTSSSNWNRPKKWTPMSTGRAGLAERARAESASPSTPKHSTLFYSASKDWPRSRWER